MHRNPRCVFLMRKRKPHFGMRYMQFLKWYDNGNEYNTVTNMVHHAYLR